MLEHRQQFARHAQPLMRERADDLTDVHIRVLSVLLGLPDHDPVDVPKGSQRDPGHARPDAEHHGPARPRRIIGIATDAGTRTSHVAILARSLGLPAVLGSAGCDEPARLGPSVRARRSRRRAGGQPHRARSSRSIAAGRGARPKSRRNCRQFARCGADHQGRRPRSPSTRTWTCRRRRREAAQSGAEGVGLMRTEFLVVGRATMPDEEEQYRAYARVRRARSAGGRW